MTQNILTDSQELETWLDEFMAEQMDKLQIPGVTFSLVQNSELFLAKGYGYANLEQQIPVSADRTLFRVGSISKLFTATAIMQLVEKGLINLHENVNKYLKKFQIEDNYPQAVTIANLLTHTAGFDDRLVNLLTLEADNLQPLEEHLAAKMPARVIPPRNIMSYSNYGYALLGYIVELLSGITFSQYVDENILKPLEMHHSSFEQASHLTDDVSIGYRYRKQKDTYQALSFQYVSILPAGSLSATATDMAKFAIAHLQYGKYKSQRILDETTARQMQQQQFTHDPRLPGWCYGFGESLANKQRVIYHAGGLPGFLSLLYLFPSHNLGLFISNNGRGNLMRSLIEQFCDRYFPVYFNFPNHIRFYFLPHGRYVLAAG
ncbi:serine hydrolase [Pleurocapsa sp. PCC 7319]|uniref:serine hydrolase domain-containing protein n=1 Tax=Pleurocapsa sp. PCC 7319 TaxID=118161 RepID=UPI0003477B5C|nr:serine hydrolase domain-containing protein [Pleurocapsa sp. PCC 7319]